MWRRSENSRVAAAHRPSLAAWEWMLPQVGTGGVHNRVMAQTVAAFCCWSLHLNFNSNKPYISQVLHYSCAGVDFWWMLVAYLHHQDQTHRVQW